MQEGNTVQHARMGSAEPLGKEATQTRLRELEAWGVDLSLTASCLELTPTERSELMLGRLDFIEQLQASQRGVTSL